jgi:hypothetical protein
MHLAESCQNGLEGASFSTLPHGLVKLIDQLLEFVGCIDLAARRKKTNQTTNA